MAYHASAWATGGSTGVDGLALLMNVPAEPEPGHSIQVTMDGAQSHTVLVEAGYVTFTVFTYAS